MYCAIKRPDVEGEHCLIEEVLRIYGFDKIPATDCQSLHIYQKIF